MGFLCEPKKQVKYANNGKCLLAENKTIWRGGRERLSLLHLNHTHLQIQLTMMFHNFHILPITNICANLSVGYVTETCDEPLIVKEMHPKLRND